MSADSESKDAIVSIVQPADYPALVDALASLVHLCTQCGANLGWICPFSLQTVVQYWKDQNPDIQSGRTVPFVAACDGKVVGCVLLKAAWAPDAPNTAEVFKLLVHPEYQRRGIASKLLVALETEALRRNKLLLFLQSVKKEALDALYRKSGYTAAGSVPNYGFKSDGSGHLVTVTHWYKDFWPAISPPPSAPMSV